MSRFASSSCLVLFIPSIILLNSMDLNMMCVCLTPGPNIQIMSSIPDLNACCFSQFFFTWRVKYSKVIQSQVNILPSPFQTFFSFGHPSYQLADSCPISFRLWGQHYLDRILDFLLSLKHYIQIISNINFILKWDINPTISYFFQHHPPNSYPTLPLLNHKSHS